MHRKEELVQRWQQLHSQVKTTQFLKSLSQKAHSDGGSATTPTSAACMGSSIGAEGISSHGHLKRLPLSKGLDSFNPGIKSVAQLRLPRESKIPNTRS